MTIKIMSRKEAMELGEKFYFTGKPCPRGHLAKRNTITMSCKDCLIEYQKRSRQRFYDKMRLQACGFEKRLFSIHPLDVPVVKQFIEFVNKSRLDKRRNNDILLVQDYIIALETAWNIENGN